jgi:hypothetical protein
VEKGSGRQFSSKDRRAQLAVYTLMNRDHDTPASYLRKHLRVNAGVFDHRRVTSRFFVVSGVRGGSVLYSRCNFAGGKLACIFIQYPQKRDKSLGSRCYEDEFIASVKSGVVMPRFIPAKRKGGGCGRRRGTLPENYRGA